MLKAMINHRFKRCTVFLCTFLLVSYAGFSVAAPPDYARDKGFPQFVEGEFDLVKQMLEENAAKLDRNADMMKALSTQLSGVETNLKAEIVLAKREINAKVDLLAQDVEDVLFILNEPDKDIQLTTEVCFDLGASWDFVYSTKLTGGLGWEGGVKIDAVAEVSLPGGVPVPAPVPPLWFTTIPIFPALSAGVGGTVCVNVPLYSIASNDHWIKDFDTSEFDALVASIAEPAQFLLPGLAKAYGDVMPNPEPVMSFLKDGMTMGSTKQASASKTTPRLDSIPTGNTILLSNGMHVTQAALDDTTTSYTGMVNSSTLLQNIMGSNNVMNAAGNACGFAAGLGMVNEDECNTKSNIVLDFLDPFCLICWLIPH